MMAYHVFEWIVVAAIVAGCGLYVIRHFKPAPKSPASACGNCSSAMECASRNASGAARINIISVTGSWSRPGRSGRI